MQSEKELLFSSLEEGCREVNRQLEVRVEPATTDSLRSLVTLGCRVLHFSGHGHPDFLPFENGRGGIHAVETHVLRQLFAAGGSTTTKLVVVSACHSKRSGQAFVDAGVPHIVAVDMDRLRDRAALSFTRAFYLALISGKTVRQAFDIGRAAVAGTPDLPAAQRESRKFLLLPEDADHDDRIFDSAPAGSLVDLTSAPVPNNLPASPDHFRGRTVELYKLITSVLEDRLVTVTGPFGRGKSALAVAAGRYLADRRHFEGVVFVRMEYWQGPAAVWQEVASVLRLSRRRSEGMNFWERMKNTPLLFILDNCEMVLERCRAAFYQFLRTLLEDTLYLRVMLTSSQSVGTCCSVTERVHAIPRLSSVDAARLFLARAPRQFLREPAAGGSSAATASAAAAEAAVAAQSATLTDGDALLSGALPPPRTPSLAPSPSPSPAPSAPSPAPSDPSAAPGSVYTQASPAAQSEKVTVEELAEHPVIACLLGNARAISLAASLLHEVSLSELHELLTGKADPGTASCAELLREIRICHEAEDHNSPARHPRVLRRMRSTSSTTDAASATSVLAGAAGDHLCGDDCLRDGCMEGGSAGACSGGSSSGGSSSGGSGGGGDGAALQEAGGACEASVVVQPTGPVPLVDAREAGSASVVVPADSVRVGLASLAGVTQPVPLGAPLPHTMLGMGSMAHMSSLVPVLTGTSGRMRMRPRLGQGRLHSGTSLLLPQPYAASLPAAVGGATNPLAALVELARAHGPQLVPMLSQALAAHATGSLSASATPTAAAPAKAPPSPSLDSGEPHEVDRASPWSADADSVATTSSDTSNGFGAGTALTASTLLPALAASPAAATAAAVAAGGPSLPQVGQQRCGTPAAASTQPPAGTAAATDGFTSVAGHGFAPAVGHDSAPMMGFQSAGRAAASLAPAPVSSVALSQQVKEAAAAAAAGVAAAGSVPHSVATADGPEPSNASPTAAATATAAAEPAAAAPETETAVAPLPSARPAKQHAGQWPVPPPPPPAAHRRCAACASCARSARVAEPALPARAVQLKRAVSADAGLPRKFALPSPAVAASAAATSSGSDGSSPSSLSPASLGTRARTLPVSDQDAAAQPAPARVPAPAPLPELARAPASVVGTASGMQRDACCSCASSASSCGAGAGSGAVGNSGRRRAGRRMQWADAEGVEVGTPGSTRLPVLTPWHARRPTDSPSSSSSAAATSDPAVRAVAAAAADADVASGDVLALAGSRGRQRGEWVPTATPLTMSPPHLAAPALLLSPEEHVSPRVLALALACVWAVRLVSQAHFLPASLCSWLGRVDDTVHAVLDALLLLLLWRLLHSSAPVLPRSRPQSPRPCIPSASDEDADVAGKAEETVATPVSPARCLSSRRSASGRRARRSRSRSADGRRRRAAALAQEDVASAPR